MSTNDKPEIVLHIYKDRRHGNDYVCAVPMAMRKGESHPSNIPDDTYTSSHELADLILQAGVSDYSGQARTDRPVYRSVYTVNERRATDMLSMLRKINRAIDRDFASEAGDMLVAFAKVIGAKRIAWHPDNERCSWLSEHTWYFENVAEGRARFRRYITEMEMAHPKNAKIGEAV